MNPLKSEPRHVSDVASATVPNLVPFPTETPDSGTLDAVTREIIAANRKRYAADFFDRKCPPAYRTTDWNDLRLASNFEEIQRVLNWQFGPRGLLLSGPARVGKTRSVWGLLRRLLIGEARRIAIFHAQELVTRIAREVSYGRDEAQDFMDAIAEAEIVFIDDLGQGNVAQSQDERVGSWLLWLCDQRLQEQRPLIATTNVPASILAGKGDRGRLRHDPLVGRLVECCEVIRFREPQ